ncbi:MAG: hypothetical protein WC635_10800 [Bacteriovorax sp.]
MKIIALFALLLLSYTSLAGENCSQTSDVDGWQIISSSNFTLLDGEIVANAYRTEALNRSLQSAIHDAQASCEGWIYQGKVQSQDYELIEQECNWKGSAKNPVSGYWSCRSKVSISCCI